jgi:hypothetical protein
MNDITKKVKAALLAKFSGSVDSKGYVTRIEDNLISGVCRSDFEEDLNRGEGHELETKFRAVHSSSALAVNCFARFKAAPESLSLLNRQGAQNIEFEKPMRIFRGGRPPNLDVWIEQETGTIAVESKFLEYLAPKLPSFSEAYERLNPPWAESSWWRAYQLAKGAEKGFLDRAQLLKHYFGLRSFQQKSGYQKPLTLLYLFWEPLNRNEFFVFQQHREEIQAFASAVAGSTISFNWMTYSDLWNDWDAHPSLKSHAQVMRTRYAVTI